MAVGSGIPFNSYTGNGVTTVFAFGFTLLDAVDLVVTVAGVESSAYTVSGLGNPVGGSITFSAAPANGAEVLLRRVIELERLTDYQDNGDLQADTVNNDFDRIWLALQQADSSIGRAVRAPGVESLTELPDAAARAGMVLSFDVSGNPSVSVPTSGTVGDLAANLASAADVTKGDGMVAVKQTKTGAVATTQHEVNERAGHGNGFMSAAQIGDVVSSAGAYDMTAALQAGIDAWNTLDMYPGLHKISGQLALKVDTRLAGSNRGKTILRGTHSGTMLYAPTNNRGIEVSNVFFQGAGCSAIKVDEATVGPLQGYLNHAHINHCDFGWELDYGINAMMLLCLIDGGTTFGYTGNGAFNPTGFVAVRSFAVSGNDVNMNVMRDVTINNAGSNGKYSVDVYGGQSFLFDRVDWEGCGRVVRAEQMSVIEFNGCWLERNGITAPNTPYAGSHILLFDGSFDPVRFRRCVMLSSETNGTNAFVEWQDATTGGIDFEGCNFGLATATQRQVYANNGAYYGLGTAGKVRWVDNYTTGGPASNPLNSNFNKGLKNTLRGWAIVSTTAPNIDASSDDSLASIAKNATGDVTLTLPSSVGSATSSIAAVGTCTDSLDVSVRCVAVATNQIRIYARKAGAGFDCTVAVHWTGK